ncbi:hypothetical protein O6H91_17G031900 [Diphasiastrum complanatum]|uniref:Uncharacterized protein n=1 Tax=Diphasiastrum complanatum TaxID=34168 RepID=A0ACC2B5H0_DIPCM|nr:hypothetical protein O6H91_17G031900 [Diphasiastrum complanatum]
MNASQICWKNSMNFHGIFEAPCILHHYALTPIPLVKGCVSRSGRRSSGACASIVVPNARARIEVRKVIVGNGSVEEEWGGFKELVSSGFCANSLNSADTVWWVLIGNGFLKRMKSSAAKMWQVLNAAVYQSMLVWVALAIIAAQPSSSHATEALLVPNNGSLLTLKEKQEQLPPLPRKFPPLKEIPLPMYEQITLPNGLRVFLLEDHELGLVGGQLLVRGGSKSEPAEKVGLALMTSVVQRSGGSVAHPADVLDTNLEEPLMPEEKLELIRSQLLGAIGRRQDDPAGIVSREFQKLLYGKDSAYARVPEIETVKAIGRNDLLDFYQQLFCPHAGVLGIWGDFDASSVKKLVQEQFGGWRSDSIGTEESFQKLQLLKYLPIPTVEMGLSSSEPFVYTVDIPGLTQGYVRMGELGTTLADPDLFSLDVLNGLLNGFGGLLFDEVRSREGLAYSVSGGWSPAVEHRGTFVAGGETRLESIPNFIQAIKKVLAAVIQDAPDSDRLDQAKAAALNSFVFNFSDSGSQLARVMSYELFGIDQNFLFQYKKGVEEVTRDQILQAAKRHLHPSSQPILVVTDVTKLAPLFSSLDAPVMPLLVK